MHQLVQANPDCIITPCPYLQFSWECHEENDSSSEGEGSEGSDSSNTISTTYNMVDSDEGEGSDQSIDTN